MNHRKAGRCLSVLGAVWCIAQVSLPAHAGVLVPNARPKKSLHVRSARYEIDVANQVLQGFVRHIFENRSKGRQTATYLFRVPDDAAVSEFAHWVDGKKTASRVMEKRAAEKRYRNGKRAGQEAAILSSLKRNGFAARLANIAPYATKRVELRYEGMLPYNAGRIQLTIPLTFPGVESAHHDEIVVEVNVRDKKPITSVRANVDGAVVSKVSAHHWRVIYRSRDVPKRDLQLSYDVQSKDLGLTFLTSRKNGKQDGYFLLLAAPQELTASADIVQKDVIYVFDNSGSMSGAKIDQARGALKQCLSYMNPGDRFGILAFSDGVNPYRAELLDVTSNNVRSAQAFVDTIAPAGGTNVLAALVHAIGMAKSSNRPKVIVFLTDGHPTSGETRIDRILGEVRRANAGAARIFVFGVGDGVNRSFLERLGRYNRGFGQFIREGESINRRVSAFYSRISKPVLTDLTIDFSPVTVAMQYPHVLPDLYKGSQLLLVGRYRGHGSVKATLRGRLNGKQRAFNFAASFPEESGKNRFLPRIWARQRIAYLESQLLMHGHNSEMRSEVIRLAKAYHLSSQYTSMVSSPRPRIASLSPSRIKPGDPEIDIRAPVGTKSVTVVFPFGVTKPARYDADRDLWSVRFLVPRNVLDGTYYATVLIAHGSGNMIRSKVAYTVDTLAPTMAVTLEGDRLPGNWVNVVAIQRVTESELLQAPGYRPRHQKGRGARYRRLFARSMMDARSIHVRLPSGKIVSLNGRGSGRWVGRIMLTRLEQSSGVAGVSTWKIDVVATDVAGNRSVQTVDLLSVRQGPDSSVVTSLAATRRTTIAGEQGSLAGAQ